MQRLVPEILEEKIDFIKKTEKPYGILLVGSSRGILEDSKAVKNDIDIFVIKESGSFEREVFYKNGLEYDISYISLKELEDSVQREVQSLIAVLANAESVVLEGEAQVLLGDIGDIYSRGPQKKSEDFLRYRRFGLTKSLETVEKKLNSIEFDFAVHNYLKELLVFYFESRAEWVPPEKKLVNSIASLKLRGYVKALLSGDRREDRLKSLKSAVDYVLEPMNGKLYTWDKSVYPFDFK